MSKKYIQIKIKDFTLDKRGPFDGEEDINLIRFKLTYPAAGIPAVETIKTIKSTEDIPSDWQTNFDRAIVFKTEIQGEAKLSVEVVCIDKESKSEKFFAKLIKGIAGATLGVWTGGFGSPYVGAISSTIGTSLIELAGSDDDIDVIGKADIMINSTTLDDISLDLNVEKPVMQKIYTRRNNSSVRRRRRVTEVEAISAGINGKVSLSVSAI